MKKKKLINRFFFILALFILSMIILIFFFSKFFWLLTGWDGLGITRVLLILFYKSNKRIKSSFKTFLIKRLGDGFLIFSLILFLYKGHLFFYSIDLRLSLLFFMFFFLGCFTKSSQYPFTSWLPVAMAAPTPVSSLVHSSTLVTAGIYLLIRFNKKLNNKLVTMCLIIRLITIVIASFAAIIEWDSKKIIAFSTLSQLGLMVLCIFLGLSDIRFFHLIVHAFFKSLMFVKIGFLLIKKFHFQDIRMLSNLYYKKKVYSFILLFVKFCLSGFFFFGSFYIKDLIYEKKFFIIKIIFMIVFYFSLRLTIIYSFRLIEILFFNNKRTIKKENNKKIIKKEFIRILILVVFSLIISWFFFFFFW